MNPRYSLALITVVMSTLLSPLELKAHFPFLAPGDGGQILLFFGENLADRTYHLPAAIQKAQLLHIDRADNQQRLATTPVESDDFVGLSAAASLQLGDKVTTQVTYGIYHGSRLDYYSRFLSVIAIQGSPSQADGNLPLDAQVFKTPQGIELIVYWNGQPVSGASVSLSDAEGVTRSQGKTNESGSLVFVAKELQLGLNALVIGHKLDQSGQWEGKEYSQSSHYLTVTFPYHD